MTRSRLLVGQIRCLLCLFVAATIFSGATAIPLKGELGLLLRAFRPAQNGANPARPGYQQWLTKVHESLVETDEKYPFLAYGTDWLAFAHLVIAMAFLGPLHDPVKNRWVIRWGMLACVMVIPFAFVMGAIRGIPLGWRLIDCSFGIGGLIPLWLCETKIRELSCLQLM
jgi:hypothetical protein